MPFHVWIPVADGTLGVDKLQPYVHSHTFQMNFMGFLRLYRITGDKSLFRKVAGAWMIFVTGRCTLQEESVWRNIMNTAM